MNSIELSDHDAALFLLFMRHFDAIGFMERHGVFDVSRGSVTLHFGEGGRLDSVEKRTIHHSSVARQQGE